MIEIKSILAPTDFSTHSERAVRYACRLAERLGSALHLLHVLSEILPAGPDPLLMPVMPAQFYKENEDRAQDTLGGLLDYLGKARPPSSPPCGGGARWSRSFRGHAKNRTRAVSGTALHTFDRTCAL